MSGDPVRLRLEVTEACHGCGVCVEVCPRGAISMKTEGGDPVGVLDHAACDLCRACLDACPVEAILEPYPPLWRPDDA